MKRLNGDRVGVWGRRGSWVGGIAILLASACTGVITSPSEGDDTIGNSGPGTIDVAPSALRRMTDEQYQNVVRDLFAAPEFAADLDAEMGHNISRLAVEKLNAAAAQVSASGFSEGVFPCDTAGSGSDACADDFIRDFGRRAFRRPLNEEERSWLRQVYDTSRTQQTFRDSLFVVLEVMLQAPQFLYLFEEGVEAKGKFATGVRPLSGYERATRLSFFLWNSTPDDELLAAAESGTLATADGMATQAARLLAHPRARENVVRLFSSWLELDGTSTHHSLDSALKSADLYPEDNAALRKAMRREVEALVERVIFEGDGKLSTLLTTRDAYVNGPLAEIYGVSGPSSADEYSWVQLPAEQRAGLFTRAAFATVYAGSEAKSPIRRGAFLLENVLCVHLGEPPPNANDTPITGGEIEENGKVVHKTIREDVNAKTIGNGCEGCHNVINPIGFAFEHYDAIGRYHDEEVVLTTNGEVSLPVDASGLLFDFEDDYPSSSVEVNGAVEMSEAMAQSANVQECLSRTWFRNALGRSPASADARSVESLTRKLSDSGSLRELILSLVTSDAFLHVRRVED